MNKNISNIDFIYISRECIKIVKHEILNKKLSKIGVKNSFVVYLSNSE